VPNGQEEERNLVWSSNTELKYQSQAEPIGAKLNTTYSCSQSLCQVRSSVLIFGINRVCSDSSSSAASPHFGVDVHQTNTNWILYKLAETNVR
jgi:hypothetical protein